MRRILGIAFFASIALAFQLARTGDLSPSPEFAATVAFMSWITMMWLSLEE